MCYFVFLKYKEKVKEARSNKTLTKEEQARRRMCIVLLGFLIISLLLFIISSVRQMFELSLGIFCALVLEITVIYLYTNYIDRLGVDKSLETYKSGVIDPFSEIIKNEFDLYTIEGINLLIEYCTFEINKATFRIPAKEVTISLVSVGYGALIAKLEWYEIINFTVVVAVLGIIIAMIVKSLQVISDEIVYPNKNMYIKLREDLEYIKATISF